MVYIKMWTSPLLAIEKWHTFSPPCMTSIWQLLAGDVVKHPSIHPFRPPFQSNFHPKCFILIQILGASLTANSLVKRTPDIPSRSILAWNINYSEHFRIAISYLFIWRFVIKYSKKERKALPLSHFISDLSSSCFPSSPRFVRNCKKQHIVMSCISN